MRFAGQIVWITGASSGIGEATAHAFAREGAQLVLSSRRTDELERVRRACARPEEHVIVPLDLARSATFPGVVAEVLARCGRVDVLINNGGVGQRSLALDAAEATERALMEVDYFGPVALTKAVLPSMRSRRSGQVVVISSVMGYLGTPGRSSYAAAKHALNGYFDSLRAEHWREGIQVTIVCPGYVQTAISTHALGAQGGVQRRPEDTQPRGISAEKCANGILRAVARRREEVYIGGREVVGIYLKRFTPWLISKMVRRMKFSVDAPP